jgi:hypothetical protein
MLFEQVADCGTRDDQMPRKASGTQEYNTLAIPANLLDEQYAAIARSYKNRDRMNDYLFIKAS